MAEKSRLKKLPKSAIPIVKCANKALVFARNRAVAAHDRTLGKHVKNPWKWLLLHRTERMNSTGLKLQCDNLELKLAELSCQFDHVCSEIGIFCPTFRAW
jgi:hypothetical protein